MSARDSFVARFGEANAAAIEAAAQRHHASDMAGVHGDDNLGSEPFRYWFLLAIGYECLTRYRDEHGITANVEEMRDWAKYDGALGEHDGDVPDYLALIVGTYQDWVAPDAATVTFDAEVQS
jgi:hypothetical protein